MGWRMKAILGLLIVLEAVNCAQLSLKDARIDDLEGQQIINRCRLENWQTRAMQDEQTIEDLQKVADEAEIALPDGLELVDAGEFECTAYCGEKYPHICGEGKGITASGAPFTPDQTVAADQSIFPFGTVLYIEGVGVRVVQDKGSGIQGKHLDVAVSGTHEDALAWEREFLLQQAADLTMTFEAFVEIYITDKKKRLRENTWSTKEHIIRTKILPYFKEKRLSEIKPRDVIAWQNEMLNYRDKNGKVYSPTYLKTLHGQLSAILNHAVRFYGLKSNAAATAGCMGSEKHKEMLFWTKEEYLKFAEAMMDKPQSYYAFEVLYWCGIREGELLALTPADFDLDKGLLSITKSYQRLKGRDVITDPKTPKSVRVIQMPQFLTDEIRDYLKSLYKVQPDQRIFEVTKSYLHHEMDRGAKEAGVKRIRIHDLRHSHVSLLIEMGFSALAIADRVGHESVDITYKYAHLFPSKQQEMAQKLDMERKEG